MTILPLSPAYREAIWVAVVLQVLATLFLLSILDGHQLAKLGGASMGGFWIGVAIIMLRRPRNPSALDLLYVRWGYIAMLIVSVLCGSLMGVFRV